MVGFAHDDDIRNIHEQPVLHHARDRRQRARRGIRIRDGFAGAVEDVVTAIRDQRLAVLFTHRDGRARNPSRGERGHHLLRRQRHGEGIDLHGQRELAQRAHHLAVVHDAHHARRIGRNDLFAQKARAPALDKVELPIDLVRTVDAQVQPLDLVGIDQRDAVFARACRRRFRRRHAAHLESARDALAQTLHEDLRRGAGAEAQHHAVLDEFQRRIGRVLLRDAHWGMLIFPSSSSSPRGTAPPSHPC